MDLSEGVTGGVPRGSPTLSLGVKGTLLVVRVHPPSLRPARKCSEVDFSKGVPGGPQEVPGGVPRGSPTLSLGAKGTVLVVRFF